MNRMGLVLRHEIYALVSRWSFWLFLLGVPLLGFLIYGGAAYLNRPAVPALPEGAPAASGGETQPGDLESPSKAGDAVAGLFAPQEELRAQGVIDQAGILQDDTALRADKREWLVYDDPARAEADLRRGIIGAYFVIQPDYLEGGTVLAYTEDYNLVTISQSSAALNQALEENVFADKEAAARYAEPFDAVQWVDLTPEPDTRRGVDSMLGLVIPYAVTSLLMMSVLGSATLLLNGLAEEKVNRTIETLLLSISAREILLGKIAGLGIVGLFQTAVWGGLAYLLLRLSGQTFALPPEAMLPPSVLAWGVVFYLLGYLLYAALMAGVGALVPGLREASQVTVVLSAPLMAPYFLLPALVTNPDSWLAVAFSLFPLTAPTGMLMRMSAGEVPLWHALLSAGLLAVSCVLMAALAARMFRAQTIMAGQKFGLKTVWRAMRG